MTPKRRIEIGLCQTCQHAKTVGNANQSRFYRCLLSDTDPDFQKYPRLPMLTCRGYHPQKQSTELKENNPR